MTRQCKDTAGTVAEWRAGQARISTSCSAISETLLLATEGKRVYTGSAFVQDQADHMARVIHSANICLQLLAEHALTMLQSTICWVYCLDGILQHWHLILRYISDI